MRLAAAATTRPTKRSRPRVIRPVRLQRARPRRRVPSAVRYLQRLLAMTLRNMRQRHQPARRSAGMPMKRAAAATTRPTKRSRPRVIRLVRLQRARPRRPAAYAAPSSRKRSATTLKITRQRPRHAQRSAGMPMRRAAVATTRPTQRLRPRAIRPAQQRPARPRRRVPSAVRYLQRLLAMTLRNMRQRHQPARRSAGMPMKRAAGVTTRPTPRSRPRATRPARLRRVRPRRPATSAARFSQRRSAMIIRMAIATSAAQSMKLPWKRIRVTQRTNWTISRSPSRMKSMRPICPMTSNKI